jgi:hypothetical protein
MYRGEQMNAQILLGLGLQNDCDFSVKYIATNQIVLNEFFPFSILEQQANCPNQIP